MFILQLLVFMSVPASVSNTSSVMIPCPQSLPVRAPYMTLVSPGCARPIRISNSSRPPTD